VLILGAGKVGRSLSAGLRAAGVRVRLQAARAGAPRRFEADIIVLAVRDASITEWAVRLARHPSVDAASVALHVAGALPVAALAPLQERGLAIGRAHPALAFAGPRSRTSWDGAAWVLTGEPRAVRAARAMVRALGARPVFAPNLDGALYHAACALLANGTIALASASRRLAERAGLSARDVDRVMAGLLESVAANLKQLGLPQSLTGPVRRGDVQTVERHASRLKTIEPSLLSLYVELVREQLKLAQALGEADPNGVRSLERWVSLGQRRP
jgi:predicted short-subunit dehydrogenase-like oxidoreductase (DUF2520 family)